MMQKAISGVTGDIWLHLACVDRLVELKEIREAKKIQDLDERLNAELS